MRKSNNTLLKDNGYKLSCIDTSEIECSLGYLSIGGEEDDTPEEYRVKITAINDDDPQHYFDIDLEDLLKWCAKYCPELMEKSKNGR